MKTALCEELGLTVPLFAFTRSPQVVVEVSKAGGMGVLGAIATHADELERQLTWIDAHIDGKPYGVDVVIPSGFVSAGDGPGMGSPEALQAMLPKEHRDFVNRLLERFDVPPLAENITAHEALEGWTSAVSRKQVEVALSHPISLIANALGPPPKDIIDLAHSHGVKVAALIGSARHATKQIAAGVDIIVAQGTEAGGHTGDVSTFVLVPEVVDAANGTHVLAAGGVGTGRQIAAAIALGAQGAWTGSIWLTTKEATMGKAVQSKLLAATSRDTVRSRALSGKPARQLKTTWSEEWADENNPDPLPMPLHFMLIAEATARIHHHASETGRDDLLTSPVGQIVGRMNEVRPAAEVMAQLKRELAEVSARLVAAAT
jgi:NAD(P)H-dependent flavin oxidoreductase YrpB (nitropropane dioxygenase family)